MYIEQLSTPNYLRYPSCPQQPLFDAVLDATTTAGNEPLARAKAVLAPVRQALEYPETAADWVLDNAEDTLASLDPFQQTDCHGYTVVGSEALTMAGVGHYIGYGRGHFFTLVPSNTDSELHMLDFLLSDLHGDIAPALKYGSLASIKEGLANNPSQQQNAMLDTGIFAVRQLAPLAEFAENRPRLWGGSTEIVTNAIGNHRQRRPNKHDPVFDWILSVYPSQLGREVISRYNDLNHAVAVGDVALGIGSTEALAGRFPENDCRASHELIRRFVGQVCVSRQYASYAGDVIEAYVSSIRTDDPRVEKLRGDLFRIAAVTAADSTAASLAAQAYSRASQQSKLPNAKTAYQGKSSKLQRYAERVATSV